MSLEVELKIFLTSEQYNTLLARFQAEGKLIATEDQETQYFECEQDLRIQKSTSGAKICLKKGQLHDEVREEIEVPVGKEQFEALEALIATLGFPLKVKWLRKRHTFDWQGIAVMLDDTKGYGQILELEKFVNPGEEAAALDLLHTKCDLLGLVVTPKEEFTKRYQYYLGHWQELLGNS